MTFKSVRILLTANQDHCDIAFEPEGAVLTLRDEDAFTVEVAGSGEGVVEITYGPDGLIVGAWDGAKTRVWNKAGEEMDV